MVIAVMEGFVKAPPGRPGPLMCDKASSPDQMGTPVVSAHLSFCTSNYQF